MRFLALFPLLCSLAAFILSLLCIFAGSKVGYLENADILTVNTSFLGEFTLKNSSSGGSGLLSELEGDLVGDIGGLLSDVAKALDIHDYYSAHLLDYCEGYYEPSPIANATETPSKNVTSCSNHTALFTFDPTAIIQSQLKAGINLTDLKWPSEIEDAVVAVETATKIMCVLYYMGVGFSGLALIGAICGFFAGGRLSASVNAVLGILAFLALSLASAIVTAVMVKVVDAVNQYGNDIGVAAYKGSTFLGMTWAATALMLVGSIGWCADCCVGRKHRATRVRDGKASRI